MKRAWNTQTLLLYNCGGSFHSCDRNECTTRSNMLLPLLSMMHLSFKLSQFLTRLLLFYANSSCSITSWTSYRGHITLISLYINIYTKNINKYTGNTQIFEIQMYFQINFLKSALNELKFETKAPTNTLNKPQQSNWGYI